jgi:GNAT superfamily N-acetyltransferase
MTGESLIIRRASPGDALQLRDLAESTFRGAYGAVSDPVEIANYIATHFTLEGVAARLEDPASLFYLAMLGDRAVGYAELRDEPPPDCVTGRKPVQLSRIYLEQSEIGRGVGAALMKACLEEASRRGCDTIWLSVWDQNHRALAFYDAWGFRNVGTWEFDFGGTIYHDPVMVKELGESGT